MIWLRQCLPGSQPKTRSRALRHQPQMKGRCCRSHARIGVAETTLSVLTSSAQSDGDGAAVEWSISWCPPGPFMRDNVRMVRKRTLAHPERTSTSLSRLVSIAARDGLPL